MKRAYLRALFAVAASAPLLSALPGCDSNVAEKIALAQLAQSCLVNSDCNAPLVCAFEACHAECESSRDCDAGARCVAAARPYKVCQLEEERACERGTDCPEGLVCGVDGECRDQCLTVNDCVEGQLCVSGTCADTSELTDAGQLTPAPGKEVGAEGAPCVYVSDCSGALLCRGQACLAECKADRDCDAGEICQDTRCVPDGSQPLACSYHSDCDTEHGQRCLGGGCRCMCAEDRDCAVGQTCDGCGCVSAPDAPKDCVYASDCDVSGQICKNRVCACECKADADCGDEQRCDGCGCVSASSPVKGIVLGTVTIDSSLQLPQYRGVTEIYGDLFINDTSIADLGDTFAELRKVVGTIQIYQSLQLTRITMPKLESAGHFYLDYAGKVEAIELPRFKSGRIDLGGTQELRTLNLESWESGAFGGYNLGHLQVLSLPSVVELGSFSIGNSLELTSIQMPKLQKVAGTFSITADSPSVLSSLEAPELAVLGEGVSAGYMQLSFTNLTTFQSFGKKPEWKVDATNLFLSTNPLLGSCAVEAFKTRLVAGGFTGTVSNQAGGPNCGVACNGDTCPN